ncbi:hypothetical protein Glove_299g101 [Diversispora epigaea]|uniref:Uncharacterized protein n=1 Tax=Diversispora epigaea TaxID=1348612 RepID=A0A397HWW9_9GLOM|nr:hypothetical protein Glove_299g101 [Diversispora epigaea]
MEQPFQLTLADTGALTYQPNSLQHKFQIPNRIGENEFISNTMNIYDWEKDDLCYADQYLRILESEDNIKPLCRFIEEALVRLLKNDSVQHLNEEILKQTFLDTLILSHFVMGYDAGIWLQAYPNFKLNGKAIDLVISYIKKMLIIEFDNIKMECIKLDETRSDWQKSNEISLSFLKKPEEEILNLKIYDENRPNQNTVREALEWKIEKISNDYLESLKKLNDGNLKCMFIVMRVGFYRLISRKVYCTDK